MKGEYGARYEEGMLADRDVQAHILLFRPSLGLADATRGPSPPP